MKDNELRQNDKDRAEAILWDILTGKNELGREAILWDKLANCRWLGKEYMIFPRWIHSRTKRRLSASVPNDIICDIAGDAIMRVIIDIIDMKCDNFKILVFHGNYEPGEITKIFSNQIELALRTEITNHRRISNRIGHELNIQDPEIAESLPELGRHDYIEEIREIRSLIKKCGIESKSAHIMEYHIEGYTDEEIGDILKMRIDSVRMRIHRTRKILREGLKASFQKSDIFWHKGLV